MNENPNNFYPNENGVTPEPTEVNTAPETAPETPAYEPPQEEVSQNDFDIELIDDNSQSDSTYSSFTQQEYAQQESTQQSYTFGDSSHQGEADGNPYIDQQVEPVSVPEGRPTSPKKKSRGFKAFVFSAIAIIVCVAILLGIYPSLSGNKAPEESTGGNESGIVLSPSPDISAYKESLSTIEIAEKVEKINVGILVYAKNQSLFSDSGSEGSGIVMGTDKSGKYTYILTCAHVIDSAQDANTRITVQDSDGNTHDASLVGLDSKTDIGVIKVAGTGFTAAEFGDSSTLRKGQKVFAIGNPGGMEFFGSFTEGMISSIDRPISSESGYEMKCIQHTTPINSGNSGGALLNEFGQVIGINSSKIVSTGYEGMAFSIPISDAKPIIDDIIANGRVTDRPKLGITYTPAMQDQQYAMVVQLKDLPVGSLVIASIANDSSLAKTAAKPYDIIIAVDGKPLDTADVLLDKIENGKVGDKMTLTLCRINNDYTLEEFDVTATLVEDTGSTSSTQEPQTQGFWDDYFNGGY